jgi:putative ABC transport system ATP-binding protein
VQKSKVQKNEPIVQVKEASKIYHLDGVSVEAVKNVTLDIREGESASIIGPSGSGKSTLMHLIGLLDKPTSGSVIIDGKRAESLSENELAKLRNQKIGFVFQTFNLLSRTSALANVMLPLQYSKIKVSEREKLAKSLLEKVGLAKRMGNLSSQLSGGEQQRVAIARALVCNPALILADEPTGNLDSKAGAQILKILAELNSEGKTIIVVTHDQKIASYTKRIISLMDGKLISDKRKKDEPFRKL